MGSTFLSSRHRELTRLRRRRRAKTQWVLWAKQQLCTGIKLFCTFLCHPCTTTTWNVQILSWLENGNGKTINLTVSLWTRVHGSPLLSSKLNSLLLSNWVTWYEGKKNIESTRYAKSIFQRRFHWRHRCRIFFDLFLYASFTRHRANSRTGENSQWSDPSHVTVQ